MPAGASPHSTSPKKQTFPEAINTSGEVAGIVWDSAGVLHGFIGTVGGPYTVYNFPSGTTTVSSHLNDSGQVAGYYADKNFTAHAYLRDTNGIFTTLNEPGQVLANAINAAGNIIGVDGGKYNGRKDGFLRKTDGTSTKIEYPGASGITSSTIPEDINQSGVIMGDTSSPPAAAAIPDGMGSSLLECSNWQIVTGTKCPAFGSGAFAFPNTQDLRPDV
jgi:hypothetical protein